MWNKGAFKSAFSGLLITIMIVFILTVVVFLAMFYGFKGNINTRFTSETLTIGQYKTNRLKDNIYETESKVVDVIRNFLVIAVPLAFISTQLITSKYTGKFLNVLLSKKIDWVMSFCISSACIVFYWQTFIKPFKNFDVWFPGAIFASSLLIVSFCFLVLNIAKNFYYLNPATLLYALETHASFQLKLISCILKIKIRPLLFAKILVGRSKEILIVNEHIATIAVKSIEDTDLELVKSCLQSLYIIWIQYNDIDENIYSALYNVYHANHIKKLEKRNKNKPVKSDEEVAYQQELDDSFGLKDEIFKFKNSDWIRDNVIEQTKLIMEAIIHKHCLTSLPDHIFKYWTSLHEMSVQTTSSWVDRKISYFLKQISQNASDYNMFELCHQIETYLVDTFKLEVKKTKVSIFRLHTLIDCMKTLLNTAVRHNMIVPVRENLQFSSKILYQIDLLNNTKIKGQKVKKINDLKSSLCRNIFYEGVFAITNKYFLSVQEIVKQLTINFKGTDIFSAYLSFTDMEKNNTQPLNRSKYNGKKFFLVWYGYQRLNRSIGGIKSIDLKKGLGKKCKAIPKLLKSDIYGNTMLIISLKFHEKYWNRIFLGRFNDFFTLAKDVLNVV